MPTPKSEAQAGYEAFKQTQARSNAGEFGTDTPAPVAQAYAPADTTAAPAAVVPDSLAARLQHIMDILGGTGTSAQGDTWADQTANATTAAAAPAPAAAQAGSAGTATGGGHSAAATSGEKAKYQSYAQSKLSEFDWSGDQLQPLIDLWTNESGWSPTAGNTKSGAFGIAQFLDSTWAGYGKKTADPYGQIDAGLKYIQARYGSPQAALAFWQRRVPINGKDVGHWY